MPHLDRYGDPSEGRPWVQYPTPFGSTDDSYDKNPDLAAANTTHELRMLKWSYYIRSTKEDWEHKIMDPEIRQKWKHEILEQEQQSISVSDSDISQEAQDARLSALTEDAVEYLLDEVRYLATVKDPKGIKPSCFDSIYESDSLISEALRGQLSAGVSKLEEIPEEEKDWHPGSKKQVLDLVHPSLYPLRYGITLVREADDSTNSKVLHFAAGSLSAPVNWMHQRTSYYSENHQWLPTDFETFKEDTPRIQGYINNLHPELHGELYPVIAQIFGAFLPLFERVLSDLKFPPPRRITGKSSRWYPESFRWNHDEDDDLQGEAWVEFDRTRKINVPAPKPFTPPLPRDIVSLNNNNLQVIIKIANIDLTPENPHYEGGSYHVEGMQNEHIVASGIYYWDEENIGESRLEFRGTFDGSTRLDYEQDDHRGVNIVYGIRDGAPCVQPHNSLETCANRCIAFPNIYQHRVSSFSLLDPTKPGHRKILCFFLVDPHHRIPSTTTVAPQQRSWME